MSGEAFWLPPSSPGGPGGGGPGGGSEGLAPTSIAGLSAWFDADTLGATLADQDAVSSWVDSTGAVTVSQGTAGARPTFTADAQGGSDLAYFDGDDSLAAGNTTDLDIGAGSFTIVAVVCLVGATTPTTQNTILSKDFTRYELFETQGRFACYVGGTANGITWRTPTPLGVWSIVALRRSGSTLSGYTGHRLEGRVTNSAGNTGGSAFHLGTRPGGASANTGRLWLGSAALWKNTAIAQADLAAVVDYFARRYNVAV